MAGISKHSAGILWPSSGKAWYTVIVLTIAYMIAYTDRLILSLLIDPVKDELNLTDTQMSIIVGASFALFYSTMAFPIARYADRGNRRNLLIVCAILWSLMTALCGLAVGFWTLFLARVGVAVGEACIGPTSMSLISDNFPVEKRSRPIGVWYAGAALASVATFAGGSTLLMPDGPAWFLHGWLGDTFSPWRIALIALGLLGIPMAIFLFTLSEPSRKERRTDEATPVKEVIGFVNSHRAMFFSLFLGTGFVFLVLDGIFIWLTPFFNRVHGLSPAEAGPYIGMISIVGGLIGTIGSSFLYDAFYKRGHKDAAMRGMIILLIAAAIGISFAPNVASLGMSLFGFAIFIAAMVGASTLPQMALQTVLPDFCRAQVTAFYFFIANLFGFGFGTLITALMTDYVFEAENMVGSSMGVLAMLFIPCALFTLYRGLPAFRASAAILTKENNNE
ncbi:MAG: MFS transporter [Sphingorhabdus sp.]